MSYQNGGGPSTQLLQEIGMSPAEIERKKSNRRLLFTGSIVCFLLVSAVMAWIVHGHQQRAAEELNSIAFGISSLEYLDKHTDTSAVPSGCETTILLLRHCEKLGDEVWDDHHNEHCSYIGQERSHYIPTLFGPPEGDVENDANTDANSNAGGKWPVPTLLYALSPKRKKHLNFREVETLIPLANKYGLEIQQNFTTNDQLANHFFDQVATGDMCGKVAVISWRHEMIGSLARKFACRDCPTSYPDQFDDVWQLKFVYHVKGTNVIQKTHDVGPAGPTVQVSEADNGRQLRKKVRRHKRHSWSVYSTITHQNFDPLKFSFKVGDYSGDAKGGRWFEMDDEGEM